MTEAMRPFLRDRKRDVPLCGTEDAVWRIMEWFTSGSSIQGQLEDAQYNEPLYAQLGWQDERHFDVVSSFWTVFAWRRLTVAVSSSKTHSVFWFWGV